MTQAYLNQIADTSAESGDDLASRLNGFDAAHKTNQAGTTRPSGIGTGGLWTKDNEDGTYTLMLFDGATDIALLNYSAALASIAALTTAANKMIYTTAANTYAVAALTAFARTLLDDADADTARATLGAPALPTETAGVGQWVNIAVTAATSYTLPSGGTWAWFILATDTPGNTVNRGRCESGVNAGGATVAGAVSGVAYNGFAWRIA